MEGKLGPIFTCRTACLAGWVVAAVLSSGCSAIQGVNEYVAYNDTVNDFVLGWRNHVWARQAWHERKYLFVNENQFHSFGEGFRDGYADVAAGANGCPPPLPPRKYWSWKYQSPEGQAKTAAWFAGYPYGAAAAQEDGAGQFQQIQVSDAIERQYSPEFQSSRVPQQEVPAGGGSPPLAPPQGPDRMPTSVPRSNRNDPAPVPLTGRALSIPAEPIQPQFLSVPAYLAPSAPQSGVVPAAHWTPATSPTPLPAMAPAGATGWPPMDNAPSTLPAAR